jgi:hypothetical protein
LEIFILPTIKITESAKDQYIRYYFYYWWYWIAGYTGDGLEATLARINYTDSLTIDVYGNLYFGDIGNHEVVS